MRTIRLSSIALHAGLVLAGLSSACTMPDDSLSSDIFGAGGSTTGSGSPDSAAAGTGGSGGAPECTPDNASSACDDGNECTADACPADTCVYTPSAVGSPCGADGQCDGNGACVPDDPALLWARLFLGTRDQIPYAMAVDAAGHVAVTGQYADTINLGGGSLPQAAIAAVFVAKLDSAGNHVWSKGFECAEAVTGSGTILSSTAVTLDGAGNVTIAGIFSGAVDFGGGELVATGPEDSPGDFFVAKFDPAGNHLWSKKFGGENTTERHARIAAGGAGDLIVSGLSSWGGDVDFGGGPLSPIGGYDIVMAKLDSAGNHLWSKRFGQNDSQSQQNIAVDGSGNVILAGLLAGTVDFGGGSLSSAGKHDVFVVKLDPAGDHVFSKRFGDAEEQRVMDVAADESGNIALGGRFTGTLDFGNNPLANEGVDDGFVAMLDSSGNHLWSRSFGGNGNDAVFSVEVALDASGNTAIEGYFYGTADFGAGPLSSAGNNDIFLVKYDTGGAHVWSKHFGDASPYPQLGGVACDGWGHVYAVGQVIGDVNFGAGTQPSEDGADLFIAKFNP